MATQHNENPADHPRDTNSRMAADPSANLPAAFRPDFGRLLNPSALARKQDLEIAGRLASFDSANPIDHENAAKIADLFKRVYGEGYVEPEFVNLQLLLDKINSGHWSAYFIYDENNEKLVAHSALLKWGDRYEFARYLVDPACQSQGYGKVVKLLAFEGLIGKIATEDVALFFEEAVTAHTRSQLAFGKVGPSTNGLCFLKYTDFFGIGERESVAAISLVCDPAIKEQRKVNLPPALAPLAEHVYRHLGCAREITCESTASQGAGQHTVDRGDFDAFGISYISCAPDGAIDSMLQAAAAEELAGAQYISAKINLAAPLAALQAEALLDAGFLFSGIDPLTDADILTLQKPRDFSPARLAKMQLAAPESVQLRDLIIGEYEARRAAQGGSRQ